MSLTTGSYIRALWRLLLFFAAPLLLELLVYLRRPEILPAAASLGSVLLALFYCGILFAAIAALLALLFSKTGWRVEYALPCLFFGLFMALIANRLLPFDSGFTLRRVAGFAMSGALAAAFWVLAARARIAWQRMLAAQWIFCALAAASLGTLFELPLRGPFFAWTLLPGLFAFLCFVPARLLAVPVVLALLSQIPSRTVVPSFAPPVRLAPYSRVMFVGIDGLSPDVIRKMVAAGQLPAFSRMMQEGVSGKLHTIRIPFSPLVWNTIYTGTEPQKHGIQAFTHTGVAGAQPFLSLWLDEWTNSDWIHKTVEVLRRAGLIRVVAPATGKDRKEPAIWNMVDQNGAASTVLGGWTTYPPETIRGTFVSDYAPGAVQTAGTYYPISKQLDTLLAYRPDVKSAPEEIQRYVAKDEKIHRISMALFPDASPDTRLLFAYYCSVDAYGHHYGTHIDMKSTPAAEKARLLAMREDVYRRIDRYLADYLKLVDDRTLLIVCSDHGFHFDKRQHNYPLDGILLMMGKGVRRNTTIEDSVLDIAPTVLYALGLPPSATFQGQPIKQAFEGIIPAPPARSYAPASGFFETAGKEALDEQKLQELEDLQYINR